MIWLLRQHLSVRKVAALFDLSPTRVEQIVGIEEMRIEGHARREIFKPTLKATERLARAGALRGGVCLGVEPPDDWPVAHRKNG